MRSIVFECLVLLCVGSLAAAPATEITGKWTAQTLMSAAGSETPSPTTFTFKVEGDKLTGTVTSPRGEYEILDGKVEGDTILFSILVTGDSPFEILYDGKITAEGIDFISKVKGRDRSDHFIATRVSK